MNTQTTDEDEFESLLATGFSCGNLEKAIENGFDVNTIFRGKRAIDILIERDLNGGNLECIGMLLNKGADLTLTNKEGLTPFQYAEKLGKSQIMQLFETARGGGKRKKRKTRKSRKSSKKTRKGKRRN